MGAVNVMLAALGAAGVLAMFLAVTLREPGRFWAVDAAEGRARPAPSGMERLSEFLLQADVAVTPGEFLRVSALLSVGVGLGVFALSGIPAAGIMGALVGGLGYWMFLTDRRDARRQEYQESLADVVSLLVEGYRSGGTLQTAIASVATYGPEVVRGDFERLAAQLAARTPLAAALQELAAHRRDPILDVIVETLLVQDRHGGRISEALEGLRAAVRERVRIRSRVRAEQAMPKWELRLVGGMPFAAALALRWINPQYTEFWGTALGQFSLLVAWGLTLTGFYLGNLAVRKATQVGESYGVRGAERKAA